MGLPSFNLCDSEENIGAQDHSSCCKIKAFSELPLQKIPHSDTVCNYHARGRIAAGVWGDASKQKPCNYFNFLFFLSSSLFSPSLNIFPFLASQNNTM